MRRGKNASFTSHLLHKQVALEEPVVMDAWVTDVQGALESVRTRLHAFRSLLLQVVASMVHTDEPAGDGDGEGVRRVGLKGEGWVREVLGGTEKWVRFFRREVLLVSVWV